MTTLPYRPHPPGRLLALALALLLLVAGVPTGALAAGAGATPEAGATPVALDMAQPLDLAAAQLDVTDFADAGLRDIRAELSFDTDRAEDWLDPLSGEPDPSTGRLADDGFVRGLFAYWSDGGALIEQTGDPDAPIPFRIDLYASQFADADGAEAAWDRSAAGLDAAGGADPGDLGEVDASAAFALDRDSDFPGEPAYRGVIVAARVGGVILATRVLTQPDSDRRGDEADVAADLAARSVGRLADRAGWETGDLGLDPVRFADPELHPFLSAYMVSGGEAVWQYWDTDDDARDDEAAFFTDQGVIDVYITSQEFLESEQVYTIHTVTFALGDEAEAEDFLETKVDNWREGNEVTDLDVPELGEDTTAFTMDDVATGLGLGIVSWRDGDRVHEIQFQLNEGQPSEAAVVAVVEAQADCTAAGDCWRVRNMPQEVLEDAGLAD